MSSPRVEVVNGRIRWYCKVCDRPVAAGAGYLHVDTRRVQAVKKAHDDWEEDRRGRGGAEGDALRVFPLSEFMELPSAVSWEVHHRDCDPEPDRDDYWTDVKRVDRYWKVLHWTAHLMGKNWLSHTRWDLVLYAFTPEGRSA